MSVSVIIPARDEGPVIRQVIDGIRAALPSATILVVVDSAQDKTMDSLPHNAGYWVMVSTYGPGPANAIRFGVDQATAPVVVVMMADGSDDPSVLPAMVKLVRDGAVVGCASRYMRGGRQVGGPLVKRVLSRAAGLSLYHLAGTGTHDATNAYKSYDAGFLKKVTIESRLGFEMGIEMVAKATVLRLPVAEVPVTWVDRTQGTSHFRLRKWLPAYFHWWRYAVGAKVAS